MHKAGRYRLIIVPPFTKRLLKLGTILSKIVPLKCAETPLFDTVADFMQEFMQKGKVVVTGEHGEQYFVVFIEMPQIGAAVLLAYGAIA
jgi:hypothetical protein